jgi:hypothetical protein
VQLYDCYHPTSTYGYLICTLEAQIDIILTYRPDRETNVLALLDNQNRASEQFPLSKPQVTCPIHPDELHLVEQVSAWGQLDAKCDLLIRTQAEWQREHF